MTLEDVLAMPMAERRACLGKERFDNRASAGKALANHVRRHKPGTLGVYRCKTCGGFHIGNRS